MPVTDEHSTSFGRIFAMNFRLLALCLALPFAVRADYLEDLNHALQRLRSHQSYAWVMTLAPSVITPEGRIRTSALPDSSRAAGLDAGLERTTPQEASLRAAPLMAVTDKNVGSVITACATHFGADTSVRVVLRDGQAVAETDEGWFTLPEIEAALAAPPQRQRTPPSGVPIWNSFRVARGCAALRPPAEELLALLADSNPPMQVNSEIVATLSEQAAIRFLTDHDSIGMRSAAPQSASGDGSVTIWLKQGEVVKYEVRVGGSAFDQVGHERNVRLVKTTTFSQFDRAKVSVPKKALAKLAATARTP